LAQEAVTERIDTISCDAHSAADLIAYLDVKRLSMMGQIWLIGAPPDRRLSALRKVDMRVCLTTHRGLFTVDPVELKGDDGGNCLREARERAAVVHVKDSPGLQIGDGLLDPVADLSYRLVEFFFPVEKGAVRWFPDGSQHAVPDVALVTDPVGRVESIQYAGNLKCGRVVAIPADRVRYPFQPAVKVAGDLGIQARSLVLAGVQLGVIAP